MNPEDLSKRLSEFDAPALERLAARLLGDVQMAEDVVQEAYLLALRQGRFGAAWSGAWWRGVVRNLSRLSLRTRVRQRRRESRVALEVSRGLSKLAPGTDVEVARVELQHRLTGLVIDLDEPFRIVVVRRFMSEMPLEQIAEDLGIPLGTVKSRLRRGLEKLRVAMGDEDMGSWRCALLGIPPLRTAAPQLEVAHTSSHAWALWAFLAGGVLISTAAFTVWQQGSATEGASNAVRTSTAAVRQGANSSGAEVASIRTQPLPEDPGAFLSGRVMTADGSPASGAHILAFPIDSDAMPLVAGPEGSEGALHRTLTDNAGHFRLLVKPRDAFYTVTADHQDLGVAYLAARAGDAGLEFILGASLTQEGRVLNDQGEAIAGARVTWEACMDGRILQRQTLTQPDGGFVLPSLPLAPRLGASVHAQLKVEAAGYGPSFQSWSAPATKKNNGLAKVVMRMEQGVRITGRVTDTVHGEALSGARIFVAGEMARHLVAGPWRQTLISPLFPNVYAHSVSGHDGRFVLDHVPSSPGSHNRTIWLAGWSEGHTIDILSLDPLESAASRSWNLQLTPVAVLSGRIVDAEGASVVGARIERALGPWSSFLLDRLFPSTVRIPPSDSDGMFRIPALWQPDPQQRAEISGTIVPPQSTFTHGGWMTQVALPAGQESVCAERRLRPLRPLQFLVTDATGSPVQGASISPTGMQLGAIPTGHVITDVLGQASFQIAAERLLETPLQFVIEAPGFARYVTQRVVADDVNLPYKCSLLPGGTFEGVIRTPGGKPRAGLRVYVGPAQKLPVDLSGSEAVYTWNRDPALFHAVSTTDHDGRFAFESLPPGPWRLLVEDLHAAAVTHDWVDLTEKQNISTIALAPQPSSLIEVRVQVSDVAAGRPLLAAQGRLIRRNGEAIQLTPQGPGILVAQASPGPWRLEVTSPSRRGVSKQLDLVKRKSQEHVRLHPEPTLKGRALLPNETLLGPRSALTLIDNWGRISAHVRVDEDGYFSVPKAWSGLKYRAVIQTRLKGREAAFVTSLDDAVLVSPNQPDEQLILRVVRAGRLRLKAPSGPIGPSTSTESWSIRDARGRTVAAGPRAKVPVDVWLPPGRYTLECALIRQTIRIVAKETTAAVVGPR